jgi:hypothetical protein
MGVINGVGFDVDELKVHAKGNQEVSYFCMFASGVGTQSFHFNSQSGLVSCGSCTAAIPLPMMPSSPLSPRDCTVL